MRAELGAMKVKDLKRRARSLGIDEDLIDDLDDAPDVKAAAIALIIKATPLHLDDAALRAELSAMPLKQLKRRAKSLGVDEETVADLDDADDVKARLTPLCNSCRVAGSLTGGTVIIRRQRSRWS